jgi:hypothetical protein
MARMWPLTVTQDTAERLAPDGNRKTGQQLHIRCASGECGQSVFCAGNDSGSYTWVLHRDVEPAIVAHLMQCHRPELGLHRPEDAS